MVGCREHWFACDQCRVLDRCAVENTHQSYVLRVWCLSPAMKKASAANHKRKRQHDSVKLAARTGVGADSSHACSACSGDFKLTDLCRRKVAWLYQRCGVDQLDLYLVLTWNKLTQDRATNTALVCADCQSLPAAGVFEQSRHTRSPAVTNLLQAALFNLPAFLEPLPVELE